MPLKTFLRVGAYYQSISGKALSTDLEITEIVNNDNPLEPFINDESAGGGAGGSATLQEDITYAALVVKINAGTLSKGQQYKITDYATKHYIVDGGGNGQQILDIITGTTEPIIVTAISVSKISSVAYSTLYPQDVIHYDWNPANWLEDTSFADYTVPETPVLIAGFKGVIHFRHDTLLDNYMGYDFRAVKFRRWKTNIAVWNGATAYVAGNYAKDAAFVYKAIQAGTNITPLNQPTYWIKLLDLNPTEYWNNTSDNTNGIPSAALEYQDFLTFVPGAGLNETYENGVRQTHIEPFKDNYIYKDMRRTMLSNNVFFLNGGTGYFTVFKNTMRSPTNNTIGFNFMNNNIDNEFSGNQIGCYFNYNTIGILFEGNTIGNFVFDNQFANAFQRNVVGPYLQQNTFGQKFTDNTLRDNFKMNQIANNLNVGNVPIDFSAATHVYAAYSCQLFVNNASAQKLLYYNGITPTVVNANA